MKGNKTMKKSVAEFIGLSLLGIIMVSGASLYRPSQKEAETGIAKKDVEEVSKIDNHSASKQDLDPSLLGSVINKNYTTDIPFEWSGDLPIITVNINGKDHKFLFDTDAPTTIPEHLVNELQLQTVGDPIKLYDSDGRQLERFLYKLPLLKIGDISFKDYVVMSDDFKSKFPLSCLGFDGIFGYNYMKDLIIKLDYMNQKITFSDKEIPHKNYTPVAIHFRPVQGPVVEIELPFAKGNFIIDTGKNTDIQLGDTGVIPEMDKLNYEYRDTRGTYSSSIGGQNTDRQKREYLLTDFTISPSLKIKSFPMSVDQSHSFLIGNQFLKHFNIIIDFPNQKAYFQNTKDGAINEGFIETFGFVPFWNENDGLFISAITDKTPASKANLKVGDKIVTLSGKDVSNMKESEFCSLMLNEDLNKKERLKITIQRDNTQKNITLEK